MDAVARGTIVGGVAVLLTAYCLQDNTRRQPMVASARSEGLSPDLIPFISEPDCSIGVVEVLATRLTRQKDRDLDVDRGPVTFRVRRSIHGTLPEGQNIEVPAKRVSEPSARVRNHFDAWNTLSLQPGELIILAARPGAEAGKWNGVAAQRIAAQDAGEVQGVRQAYEIEQASGSVDAKAKMLTSALHSDQNVLVFYALNYLRRHGAERQGDVRVLANAVSSAPPSEKRLELGRAITGADFFKASTRGDAIDILIVASLAGALVQETDDSRRVAWAQLLGSCLLMDFTGDKAENLKIRSALIGGAGRQPEVERAIASAERSASPDARPMLERLKEAWRNP